MPLEANSPPHAIPRAYTIQKLAGATTSLLCAARPPQPTARPKDR
uniref:Uncharacterized protein n=1 Tax=Arundo donax TaxID=35708 RepID=A0A0A9A9Y5_ARUDO